MTPDAKDLCVFAVKRGDITGRFDVRNLKYSQSQSGKKQEKVSLGSLTSEEPCYGTSASAIERTDESQPKYIRITDFDDFGIEDNHKFVEGRIDADYYSPKFSHFRKQIEALPYRTVSVNDISEKIVSGFAAGKQDQADNLPEDQRVPHLRPFSITPEGELSFETKKYVPKSRLKSEDYCKKNEVIFNNTNSPDLVGKTTVFDSDVLCAASNHMTRITVKEGVNPYYVAAFFNVLLSIGYWKLLCTNFNNQAGVNTDTLKRVKIPLPPKEIQDQIAAELMQRRSQANVLRRQAIKEWADAKAQFEKELLGE